MTLLAVKTLGVVLGVLPCLFSPQCNSGRQLILSGVQIVVTVSIGVGHASLYIVYMWIPSIVDSELSMKVTEALSEIFLCICSLLIILCLWHHSRSLSSVIKICSATSEETHVPHVSPHLLQTQGVAVNQCILWFIIFQAVYEGTLYALWYVVYDMNIRSVFLKMLFLFLQLWITLILRFPQIMWVAIGTALQHQLKHFNHTIEAAASADHPLTKRQASTSKANEPGGDIMVDSDCGLAVKDSPDSQAKDDDDHEPRNQAQRSESGDSSSRYQKVRANLAYMRERYKQLQQILRDTEAVLAGPLLISSFSTFCSSIFCLFHGIALDLSVFFKMLVMTQYVLQIAILWTQGQVADSITAEGQKASQILMEIAEAATRPAPLPLQAKQTISIMLMERLSRKGLGTRVCGLFTLSRRNTLAVAGASTSYLLILLQFHLADL
ncbi:uncharacterized protein LOC122258928 [Penaeus japonicus]|uniref:uncharacterized protein LOC122258928 n=1 Tax=Penaeus japonicus TaxID=27405 RepID=UPI001C70BBA1|nr:uncharacterized protein LOC122258928 [Penaeus japonicus]